MIFLECISAFTSRSTITYQNQFPFFIKQQLSLRRFRPLLADDAKTKVKSYDTYFQKWTTLKIEDIKLLYQNILTANSKSVKDEMMQVSVNNILCFYLIVNYAGLSYYSIIIIVTIVSKFKFYFSRYSFEH